MGHPPHHWDTRARGPGGEGWRRGGGGGCAGTTAHLPHPRAVIQWWRRGREERGRGRNYEPETAADPGQAAESAVPQLAGCQGSSQGS